MTNDRISLSRKDMMEAVSEGVRRAVWQMITNATDMPCADFFDAVKEGVAEGIKSAAKQGG